MKFMIEGLREIFFFGKGLSWNIFVIVFVWIGIVSMVIILVIVFKCSVVKGYKIELNV